MGIENLSLGNGGPFEDDVNRSTGSYMFINEVTIAGGEDLLVVGVVCETADAADMITVTLDPYGEAKPLTEAAAYRVNNLHGSIWYTVDLPSTPGNYDLSFNNGSSFCYGVAGYWRLAFGAKSTGQPDAFSWFVTSGGNEFTNNITTIGTNAWIFDIVGTLQEGSGVCGVNQTEEVDAATTDFGVWGSYRDDAGAPGIYGMTWDPDAAPSTIIHILASFAPLTTDAWEQEGFQFREDDDVEADATDIGAQDANMTAPAGVNRRLRTLSDCTGDPGSAGATLQYKRTGDAATEWRDVPES